MRVTTIRLPAEDLDLVDDAWRRTDCRSRSEFIRRVAVEVAELVTERTVPPRDRLRDEG